MAFHAWLKELAVIARNSLFSSGERLVREQCAGRVVLMQSDIVVFSFRCHFVSNSLTRPKTVVQNVQVVVLPVSIVMQMGIQMVRHTL